MPSYADPVSSMFSRLEVTIFSLDHTWPNFLKFSYEELLLVVPFPKKEQELVLCMGVPSTRSFYHAGTYCRVFNLSHDSAKGVLFILLFCSPQVLPSSPARRMRNMDTCFMVRSS